MRFLFAILNHPLIIFSVLAVAAVVVSAVGAAHGFFTPVQLLWGIAAIIALVILNVLVASIVARTRNENALTDCIDDISKLMTNNRMNWVVNQRYIHVIESESEETWAFAPELTYAIQPDSEIFKGIAENLKKGHRYKIFMPDQPRVHKIIADYHRLHTFDVGQVRFILIPPHEFLFHTIITIYGVNSDDPRAIEWLPVRDLDVWCEMDSEHSQRMIGIGQIMLKKYADFAVDGAEKEKLMND